MRHLFHALGFSLIVLVLFIGCTSTPSQGSGVQLTHQPDPSHTDLKIGNTAIFDDKGYKKSVRVTGFHETNRILYFATKNVGDTAIAKKSRMWIVDWNGVHYDLPELRKEGLSSGESRPELFNLYQLHGMQDSTKKGKVTF